MSNVTVAVSKLNISTAVPSSMKGNVTSGIVAPSLSGSALVSPLWGLTFGKDYTNTSSLNADYALGSPTATYAATRSASAPASYVDSSGVIQIVTTNTTPRFPGGYYSSSGFQAQSGLLMEGSATNLLTRTDGTAASSGLWTGWSLSQNVTGTVITTNNVATQKLNISGSVSQQVRYTGIVTDVSATLQLQSTSTGAASVAVGNVCTFSMLEKSTTGNTGVNITIRIEWRDAANASLGAAVSSSLSLTSSYRGFSLSGTAPASTDHVSIRIGASSGVDNGDTIDFEVIAPQFEIGQYATSFIPTTTASLTRNGETLTYPWVGNRNDGPETMIAKYLNYFGALASSQSPKLIDSTAGKRRLITLTQRTDSTTTCAAQANLTDSPSNTSASSSPTIANGTAVTAIAVFQHVAPFAKIYCNVTSTSQDNTNDFTNTSNNTTFNIGSTAAGQAIFIMSIAFFGYAMTSTQVSAVSPNV